MKRSSLVKVITLSSFVFFIVAFLFFRSGAFDGYFYGSDPSVQTSPNGGAFGNRKAIQRTPARDSNRVRMSSSKSLIVYDGSPGGRDSARGPIYVVDGKIIENGNDINPDDIEDYQVLQGAAAINQFGPTGKYGVIVMKTKRSMILKKDTLPGHIKIDSATERMLLMSGSKSGPAFTPAQIDSIINHKYKKKKN